MIVLNLHTYVLFCGGGRHNRPQTLPGDLAGYVLVVAASLTA